MRSYILMLMTLLGCADSFATIDIDTSGTCSIDQQRHSAVGYGTYPLRGDVCTQAIKRAIDTGYSIIDTATFYENFDAIAAALRGQNRSNIYLISKVWPDAHTSQRLREDLSNTLTQLKTSYLDAYLLHWPNSSVDIQQTLDTLSHMRQQGFIRHIGLSNITVNHIKRAIEYGIRIDWVQVEMHPGFCDFELLNFCRDHQIGVQAWAPLSRGKLTHHALLMKLGAQYNKTAAQIALRWITQHGCIPLPGTKNIEHMRQNREIFDFELSPEDMSAIDAYAKCGQRERVSQELGLGFADEFDFTYEKCWPCRQPSA